MVHTMKESVTQRVSVKATPSRILEDSQYKLKVQLFIDNTLHPTVPELTLMVIGYLSALQEYTAFLNLPLTTTTLIKSST
jgi:hypothetical protein